MCPRDAVVAVSAILKDRTRCRTLGLRNKAAAINETGLVDDGEALRNGVASATAAPTEVVAAANAAVDVDPGLTPEN